MGGKKVRVLVRGFITVCMLLAISDAQAYLPEKTCSEVVDMFESCKVWAEKTYLGREGATYIKLYPAASFGSGENQAAAHKSLDKLAIFVGGFGSGLADVSGAISSTESNSLLASEFDETYLDIEGQMNILRANGVSVLIVLGGEYGKNYLQLSAYALESTLQFLNDRRSDFHPISIIGYSAGGVVSRFALADMERQGIDHGVGLYVSYDAPHNGAYIPQSLQALLPMLEKVFDKFEDEADDSIFIFDALLIHILLQPEALGLAFWTGSVDDIKEYRGDMESTQDALKEAEKQFAQLNRDQIGSIAAKQLVIDHIDGGDFHNQFIAELDNLGFPSRSRNVGVTHGSINGVSVPSPVLDESQRYFYFFGDAGDSNWLKFELFPTKYSHTCGYYKINWGWEKYWGSDHDDKDWVQPCEVSNSILESSPGSYMDWGMLLATLDGKLSEQFDERHELYLKSDTRFTFIPTSSALDVAGLSVSQVIDVFTTPFDRVIQFEGNYPHTEFFNQDNRVISEILANNRDWLIPVLNSILLH